MELFYQLFVDYYHKVYIDYYNSESHSLDVCSLLQKKLIHTMEVILEAGKICNEEDVPKDIEKLVEISCIFHDVGRFSQLIDYGTFDDSKSIDHGELSANIFSNYKDLFLTVLTEYEFNIVMESIRLHNKISIPNDVNGDLRLVLSILRDADKLQILSINLSSLFSDALDHTDEIYISNQVLSSFMECEPIHLKDIRTKLEKRLNLCGWIFDMNYEYSKNKMIQSGYIDILTSTKNINNEHVISQLIQCREHVLSVHNY